jgi:hypothetical protein
MRRIGLFANLDPSALSETVNVNVIVFEVVEPPFHTSADLAVIVFELAVGDDISGALIVLYITMCCPSSRAAL